MRTTIRKLFWAWEFDKEEKWLNEMAEQGMALCGVGWCRYEFEPCQPGEYEIRLQLLEKHPGETESRDYLAFLEETGAEHVGSWTRWVYLRRKAADGPFELFSDNASRAKHLSLIITLIGIIGGLNLFVGAYNIILWLSADIGINFLGIVNLLIGIFSMLGLARLKKKQDALKKDQNLFEG